MDKKLGSKLFNFLNITFFIIIAVAMVFPIWNILMTSFVGSSEFAQKSIVLWPDKFDFTSYKFIFSGDVIKNAFMNTTFLTIIGGVYSLAVTSLLAYSLSKKYLPGRKFLLTLIMITMFFSGGLIPYYLMIKNMGLMNRFAVLFLPCAVNTFNFIVIKSFFSQFPIELEESAKIDGASDLAIFFKIVLPLSGPVLATFFLFYAVGYWNTWYSVTLFIQDDKLFTLQYVLRDLVVKEAKMSQMTAASNANGVDAMGSNVFDEGIKMATIIVATVPILIVYPFLQKYFVKGVMIGSVKG